MRKFAFVFAALIATPLAAQTELVAADMTEQQVAALAVLTPLAQAQVPGDNGVHLAECILLSSKRREVRKFSKADVAEPGDRIIELANKVISRPAVMTCLTARLSQ